MLHEQSTRNHHCQSMEELVDLVLAWVLDHKEFKLSDRVYGLQQDKKEAA